KNDTDQDASQSQAGSRSGIQTSDQSASNHQLAVAASSASQVRPTNTNISVRVLSPGNDGNVTQSNEVSSTAKASNSNSTDQSSDQDLSSQPGCGCQAGEGIQVAEQSSWSRQHAGALSLATQTGARNDNSPVRVLSEGNDGRVSQSNSVDSDASARNSNYTDQDADQSQRSSSDPRGCGCNGLGIQVLGQQSRSEQGALAASAAVQDFGYSEVGCHAAGDFCVTI